MHEEVKQARVRSGWSAKKTLAALGIPRRSYYRWLREEAWARALPTEPIKPVQLYEALAEEKQAVLEHARRHPELRHRELAWRMVDEDVGLSEPVDGLPDIEDGQPGVPVAEKEEAQPRGR